MNNSVQFAQLKLDGAHTYIEEKASGEYLNCDFIENEDGSVDIKVENLTLQPETNAIKKVKALLSQGIREKIL